MSVFSQTTAEREERDVYGRFEPLGVSVIRVDPSIKKFEIVGKSNSELVAWSTTYCENYYLTIDYSLRNIYLDISTKNPADPSCEFVQERLQFDLVIDLKEQRIMNTYENQFQYYNDEFNDPLFSYQKNKTGKQRKQENGQGDGGN